MQNITRATMDFYFQWFEIQVDLTVKVETNEKRGLGDPEKLRRFMTLNMIFFFF